MMDSSIFNVPWDSSNGTCCNENSNAGFSGATPTASSCFSTELFTPGNSNSRAVEEMSTLVASEMNELNFREREAVYEDLHGVSRPEEETIEALNKAVANTKNEIMSVRQKSAYKKAIFLNPEYVNSDEFLLMFLRSCKLNPKQAAKKIVEHFKYKLNLFGYDKVGKDLMFEDLDDGAKNALMSGGVQLLSSRDNAGRAIFFTAFDALRYDLAIVIFR